jgi:hypothetical protein
VSEMVGRVTEALPTGCLQGSEQDEHMNSHQEQHWGQGPNMAGKVDGVEAHWRATRGGLHVDPGGTTGMSGRKGIPRASPRGLTGC